MNIFKINNTIINLEQVHFIELDGLQVKFAYGSNLSVHTSETEEEAKAVFEKVLNYMNQ